MKNKILLSCLLIVIIAMSGCIKDTANLEGELICPESITVQEGADMMNKDTFECKLLLFNSGNKDLVIDRISPSERAAESFTNFDGLDVDQISSNSKESIDIEFEVSQSSYYNFKPHDKFDTHTHGAFIGVVVYSPDLPAEYTLERSITIVTLRND